MKVGDLVKRIHWQYAGMGPWTVPQSMKKYPLEPMNGVIIEKVKVIRSALAGDPWDFVVLWESGNISQLSGGEIEKIRLSMEEMTRLNWEEEGTGGEPPAWALKSAKEMDEWSRKKYGCQCRGCDSHRGRFPLRYEKDHSGFYVPGPECIHVGENK